MVDQNTAYRSIFKSISILGGVQVFSIFVGIFRTKIVSVLLDASGLGIAGLLGSTTALIASLTNFGLSTSAVRNISLASESGSQSDVSIVFGVVRRLVWVTGMLGLLLMVVLSPWLSFITFGDYSYTSAFIWISISLLLNQISVGYSVLLQGTRQTLSYAQSALAVSVLSLFISIPFYFIYGLNGIVPAIVVSSLVACLVNWYYASKVNLVPVNISNARAVIEGKGMLNMGFVVSLGGLIFEITSYVIRVFIAKTGGIEQVGFYVAGFTLVSTYVGLVFNAMGTDYYPRLSAISHSNSKCKEAINQQAEISILVLAPIIIVCLVFIKLAILLLFTTKFILMVEMVQYALLAMLLKSATWAIGFIFLAKSESKLFTISELLSNIYILIFSMLGYTYFGLPGLGMAFLLSQVLSLLHVYFIAKLKFDFCFSLDFFKLFFVQIAFLLTCFIIENFIDSYYFYIIGTVFCALSFSYSLLELNKRLNLNEIIQPMIGKLNILKIFSQKR